MGGRSRQSCRVGIITSLFQGGTGTSFLSRSLIWCELFLRPEDSDTSPVWAYGLDHRTYL